MADEKPLPIEESTSALNTDLEFVLPELPPDAERVPDEDED